MLNDKTVITLSRLACGAAILITSMVTGINGAIQMISLVLLGLPFETLKKETK